MLLLILILLPYVLLSTDILLDPINIMSFNFPTTTKKKNPLESVVSNLGQTLPEEILGKEDRYLKPNERMNSAKIIVKKCFPTIIGFQETHKEDLKDLFGDEHIDKTYSYYAPRVGKNDGDRNAILYDKALFKQIGQGILYLNEQEQKGHNSWDDKHERACTWICLEYKNYPFFFMVYNTHLGLKHESVVKGYKQIAAAVKDNQAQGVCSLIIGDFNAETSELLPLTKDPYYWANIKKLATEISGPSYTYTGFDKKNKVEQTPDHMFASLPLQEVSHFSTITDAPHGHLPSDHYQILARLRFSLNANVPKSFNCKNCKGYTELKIHS